MSQKETNTNASWPLAACYLFNGHWFHRNFLGSPIPREGISKEQAKQIFEDNNQKYRYINEDGMHVLCTKEKRENVRNILENLITEYKALEKTHLESKWWVANPIPRNTQQKIVLSE